MIHLRSGYHLMPVFDVVFYYLVTLKLATNQLHDEKTKIRKSSAFFQATLQIVTSIKTLAVFLY